MFRFLSFSIFFIVFIFTFVLLCVGVAVAFVVGGEIFYKPDKDTIGLLGGAFLVGIGLAALTFTMASVLSKEKEEHIREPLIASGIFISTGSLLFAIALIIRYAAMIHEDMEWWKKLGLPFKTASKLSIGVFIAAPYEAGTAMIFMGLLWFLFSMAQWVRDRQDW